MPDYLKDLINEGKLKQWGKHPRILFVDGVEKARICFDEESKVCTYRYLSQITNKEQYAIFRDVFNYINSKQQQTISKSETVK